jgi:stage II sporulation protein AA (anti-sigma F factor antagonist)
MTEPAGTFAAHEVLSGDRWRLILRGELDLASAPLLEARLGEAERSGVTHVELDLSDLEFIDSTGLTVLIRAHQAAELNGHTFSLRGQSPQVRKLFVLTGTLDRFTFVDGPRQPRSSSEA